MGYDQYTVPDTVAVEPTLVTLLKHSQTYIYGLSNFFKEQSELKITHNTFRDFRVHFFRNGLSRNSCMSNAHCARLRAVPLQSVESKLGRTGESEMAERETGERLRRGLTVVNKISDSNNIRNIQSSNSKFLDYMCTIPLVRR